MGKTTCFNPRAIECKDVWYDHLGVARYMINVNCNKCENCIRRRRNEWCFRMEEEFKVCKVCWFVTFTYEKVPYDKYGNMTLVPKDLSDFFKYLRHAEERNFKYIEKGYKVIKGKKVLVFPSYENMYNGLCNNDKLRFYACGEYGELFGRSHYHAIIFNCSKKFIEECWKHGYVHIVPAVKEHFMYCTKYMDKWRDKKQDWRKQKEFTSISEGIGLNYVKKMKSFHRRNLDINFVRNDRGMMIPIPKYIRDKLFDDSEKMLQRVIINEAIDGLRDEKIKKFGLEEFNRRELDRQNFVKQKFRKETRKKRDM